MDKTPTNSSDTTPTNSRRNSLDGGNKLSNKEQSSKSIRDHMRHAFTHADSIQETVRDSWIQWDEKHSQKQHEDPWEQGREIEERWIDLPEDFSQFHITDTHQHTEQETTSQQSDSHFLDESKFVGMVSQHFKDTQEPDRSDWTLLKRKVEYIEQLHDMFSSPEASSVLQEMQQSQVSPDKHFFELGDPTKIQEAKKNSQNSLIRGIRNWEIYGSQGNKYLFVLNHIEKKLDEIGGLLSYYRNNCVISHCYSLQAMRQHIDTSLNAFLYEGESFKQGLKITHDMITNYEKA